jgi:hypothetical protein
VTGSTGGRGLSSWVGGGASEPEQREHDSRSRALTTPQRGQITAGQATFKRGRCVLQNALQCSAASPSHIPFTQHGPQQFGEQATRGAPDDVVGQAKKRNRPVRRPPHRPRYRPQLFVVDVAFGELSQRHPEDLLHFRGVRAEIPLAPWGTSGQTGYKTMNEGRAAHRSKGRQLTNHIYGGGVDADLFMGLTQRGVQGQLPGLQTTPGERHFTAVRTQVRGPAGEHDIRLSGRFEQEAHHRRRARIARRRQLCGRNNLFDEGSRSGLHVHPVLERPPYLVDGDPPALGFGEDAPRRGRPGDRPFRAWDVPSNRQLLGHDLLP